MFLLTLTIEKKFAFFELFEAYRFEKNLKFVNLFLYILMLVIVLKTLKTNLFKKVR
jgi:hypothetical protein